MNEDELAETLTRIDESLLIDEGLRSSINTETIRRLHLRRRSRNQSIAAVSIGFLAILSVVGFRIVREQDEIGASARTFPILANDAMDSTAPDEPAKVNSKPDFELATVADPAMNLELELMRESIAESLVQMARLRKSDGIPESDWRQDLDFVLRNYPGTIAAKSAGVEFGTEAEAKPN